MVKVVNYIKSNALRDHLFHKFCNKNDEKFESLVMHIERSGLSKENYLNRFVMLLHLILSFLDDKQFTEKLLATVIILFSKNI